MEFIKATYQDLNFLFELRNESVCVKYSKRGILSIHEVKKDYFDNDKKLVYISKYHGCVVGYLIFEKLGKNQYEISIAISPENRGRGLGKLIVKEGTKFALDELGAEEIIANIFPENKASLKIFKINSYNIVNDKLKPWKLVYKNPSS